MLPAAKSSGRGGCRTTFKGLRKLLLPVLALIICLLHNIISFLVFKVVAQRLIGLKAVRLNLVLAVLALVVVSSLASADDSNFSENTMVMSSAQVLNDTFSYDGKTIVYKGEVVGPVMFRGDYAWVNVHDGSYAFGVWCPKGEASKIGVYGDFNNKGDVVEVSGVFHRACAEHGGDLDIHCSSLKIVASGYHVKHTVDNLKIFTAFVLLLIAITLSWVEFRDNLRDLRKRFWEFIR